ncbi:MAG TPA: hypothetical protein DDY13_18235 [Cytophagales bacterium]|nr:hypothetical protein [Cytophagales bacterium]
MINHNVKAMEKEVLRNQLPPIYGFGNRLDFELRNGRETAVYRSGYQIVHKVSITPVGFKLRHLWRKRAL